MGFVASFLHRSQLSITMQIKAKASLETLPDLLLFIEQARQSHQMPQQICLNLQIAVEEASINAIKHGYAKLQPGIIKIASDLENNQVCISALDFERIFDPTISPPPNCSSEWDRHPVGSLGVVLIHH